MLSARVGYAVVFEAIGSGTLILLSLSLGRGVLTLGIFPCDNGGRRLHDRYTALVGVGRRESILSSSAFSYFLAKMIKRLPLASSASENEAAQRHSELLLALKCIRAMPNGWTLTRRASFSTARP